MGERLFSAANRVVSGIPMSPIIMPHLRGAGFVRLLDLNYEKVKMMTKLGDGNICCNGSASPPQVSP